MFDYRNIAASIGHLAVAASITEGERNMSQGTEKQNPHETAHDNTVTIYINASAVSFSEKEISFEKVVALAALAVPDNPAYTVNYRKGEDKKPKGSLTAGESVHVKDGMVFDVTVTGRS